MATTSQELKRYMYLYSYRHIERLITDECQANDARTASDIQYVELPPRC
jgi:hypothetical protein